ncbi:MAG: site-specific integrase ['Conium maculatum' witches'-broom phytoplasma]|nr:site-specific integrase ['Conium maculatum' witches'-broom phytoplasma]
MLEKYNFSFIVDAWLVYKQKLVKQSTIAIYHTMVKNHLKPAFGAFYEIKESDVQQFILTKVKENLKIKTIKDILIVFNMIVKFGVKKYFWRSLAMELDFPKEEHPSRVNVLNKTEYKKILTYLKANFNFKNLGILITLQTGLRIGEICALTWDDINLEKGIFTIKKNLQRIGSWEDDQV